MRLAPATVLDTTDGCSSSSSSLEKNYLRVAQKAVQVGNRLEQGLLLQVHAP